MTRTLGAVDDLRPLSILDRIYTLLHYVDPLAPTCQTGYEPSMLDEDVSSEDVTDSTSLLVGVETPSVIDEIWCRHHLPKDVQETTKSSLPTERILESVCPCLKPSLPEMVSTI